MFARASSLSLVLLAVGCNSETVVPERAPLVVGVLVEEDVTEYATVAASILERRVRANGGLGDGRRLDVVIKPILTQMDLSENIIELSDEGAIGVAGPFYQVSPVMGSSPVAAALLMPQVVVFSDFDLLYGTQRPSDSYEFFMSQPRSDLVDGEGGFARLLIERGCTRLAVVGYSAAASVHADAFEPEFEAAGLRVRTVAVASSDWGDAQIQMVLKLGNYDCVATTGGMPDSARLIDAAIEIRPRWILLSQTGILPEFLDMIDRAKLDGALVLGSSYPNVEDRQFDSVREQAQGVTGAAYTPGQLGFVAGAYDAITLLVVASQVAAQQNGDGSGTSGPQLRDAVALVSRTVGGIFGPAEFDDMLGLSLMGGVPRYEGVFARPFDAEQVAHRRVPVLEYDADTDQFLPIGSVE